MFAPDDTVCAICGEQPESPELLAPCFDCTRWFHLNPYNQKGQNCGRFSLSDDGFDTFCQDCVERDSADRPGAGSGA